MPWSPDPGFPRRLPSVSPPRRGDTEASPSYNERVWRWRCWLDEELHGRRPMQWYATGHEIHAYEMWRDDQSVWLAKQKEVRREQHPQASRT